MSLNSARLDTALDTARTALLAERVAEGHWEGELSSSALSTAVACAAMQHVQTATGTEEHGTLIQGGLHWLAEHANADGGWGDTTKSLSLSLIHISEPTRLRRISYAVFCLKKKKM